MLYIRIYKCGGSLPWHKVLNAVVAELSIQNPGNLPMLFQ